MRWCVSRGERFLLSDSAVCLPGEGALLPTPTLEVCKTPLLCRPSLPPKNKLRVELFTPMHLSQLLYSRQQC